MDSRAILRSSNHCGRQQCGAHVGGSQAHWRGANARNAPSCRTGCPGASQTAAAPHAAPGGTSGSGGGRGCRRRRRRTPHQCRSSSSVECGREGKWGGLGECRSACPVHAGGCASHGCLPANACMPRQPAHIGLGLHPMVLPRKQRKQVGGEASGCAGGRGEQGRAVRVGLHAGAAAAQPSNQATSMLTRKDGKEAEHQPGDGKAAEAGDALGRGRARVTVPCLGLWGPSKGGQGGSGHRNPRHSSRRRRRGAHSPSPGARSPWLGPQNCTKRTGSAPPPAQRQTSREWCTCVGAAGRQAGMAAAAVAPAWRQRWRRRGGSRTGAK